MSLPSLARLSHTISAGTPRADPDQDTAQDKVLRELRVLIIAAIVDGTPGNEVCMALSAYCQSNKEACAGIDVSAVALQAFGVTTTEIKDRLTAVLMAWSRPTPFRPALTNSQLVALLCDKLNKYRPPDTWTRRHAGLFTDYVTEEYMTWYFTMLTLPSKRGVTQDELDCLAGWFAYEATVDNTNGWQTNQRLDERIGYALHANRGNWRRIPWSNPNAAAPVSWARLTDERGLQILDQQGDYRRKYARLAQEISQGKSFNDLPGEYRNEARAKLRYDFWVRICITWFGIAPEDVVVGELDTPGNPLYMNEVWQLLRRVNDMVHSHMVKSTKAGLAIPPGMSEYDVEQLVTATMLPLTGPLVYLEYEGQSSPRRVGFGRADTFLDPVMDTMIATYATDYQWPHWCLGMPAQPPPAPPAPPAPLDPGEPNPGGGYGGGYGGGGV